MGLSILEVLGLSQLSNAINLLENGKDVFDDFKEDDLSD